MAEDFRSLLVEKERVDDEERWFEDLIIGDFILMSIQASAVHECKPEAIVDVMEYETFQVHLQTTRGVISAGRHDIWHELKDRSWAKLFETDKPYLLTGYNVPVATVQQIYEDMVEYVENMPPEEEF